MRSWREVTAPRVPVTVVVVVVGLLLAACCVVWAVLAQTLVPDVCSDPADVPANVGPYLCPSPSAPAD